MSPRPGRIVQRHSTPFARRYLAGEPARSIKSDPAFVALREDLIAAVMASQDTEDAYAV